MYIDLILSLNSKMQKCTKNIVKNIVILNFFAKSNDYLVHALFIMRGFSITASLGSSKQMTDATELRSNLEQRNARQRHSRRLRPDATLSDVTVRANDVNARHLHRAVDEHDRMRE